MSRTQEAVPVRCRTDLDIVVGETERQDARPASAVQRQRFRLDGYLTSAPFAAIALDKAGAAVTGRGAWAGHARRVAPGQFIASVPSVVDDPGAPLLASFSDYLRRVRGLEPKSREGVLLGARRFLDWFRHHHPGQDVEALTAEHVLAAIEHRLSLSATSATRTAATSHIRNISSVFALGWPPRSRSRPRRPKNGKTAKSRNTAQVNLGGDSLVTKREKVLRDAIHLVAERPAAEALGTPRFEP